MRAQILLAGAALAAGCAVNPPGYEGRLAPWVGQDRSALVAAWGEPGEVLPGEAGETLVYATLRTEKTGARSMSIGGGVGAPVNVGRPAQVRTYWCKTWFELDAAGTVTGYGYDGNDCER